MAVALEVVRTKVPAPQRRGAIAAVFCARKGRNGGIIPEGLKEAPGKHGLKSIKEASQKIVFLKSLGIDEWDISSIGGERIRAYSRAVVH